jgi:TRAP transporter TAXI family solute receptor
MKKVRVSKVGLLCIFVLILSLVVVGCGEPKQQQQSESPSESTKDQQVNLNFASMSMGGSWYVYAVNIAELIKTYLPAGSTVDVFPYQGGVGNPILVNNGEADIALSFSAIGNWAYNGIVDYEEKGKMANIRALVGGLNKPHRVGILTTKNSGINSIQDIKDKNMKVRLLTVQRGGSGETLARQVLEAYGMTYDDIIDNGGSVSHIDLPVAVQQMQDGQADLFIHNIGYKQPDIVELCLRGNIRFLTLDPDKAELLCEKYGHENGLKIEKDEFNGVKEDIPAIGYPTGVIANKDLPEDIAYLITKAICENKEMLVDAHASLAGFEPTEAWKPTKNGSVPLHPGAEKYYKEKGWIK